MAQMATNIYKPQNGKQTTNQNIIRGLWEQQPILLWPYLLSELETSQVG